MSTTHDYDTEMIYPLELDRSSVLVGECGGLSAVFGKADKAHDLLDGFVIVDTEHGPLRLQADMLVEVLVQVGAK